MAKPTFQPMTDHRLLVIDSESVDPTQADHLNPHDSNPFYFGEWFEYGANGVKRATGNAPSYVMYAEFGSPDIQLNRKLPIVTSSNFRARTKVYDASATYNPNTILVVGDVTVDGQTKSGLKPLPNAAGDYWVVGYVIKKRNDGYLEFRAVPPYRVTVS